LELELEGLELVVVLVAAEVSEAQHRSRLGRTEGHPKFRTCSHHAR